MAVLALSLDGLYFGSDSIGALIVYAVAPTLVTGVAFGYILVLDHRQRERLWKDPASRAMVDRAVAHARRLRNEGDQSGPS